jgi:hypothetical protein
LIDKKKKKIKSTFKDSKNLKITKKYFWQKLKMKLLPKSSISQMQSQKDS